MYDEAKKMNDACALIFEKGEAMTKKYPKKQAPENRGPEGGDVY